MYSSSLILLLLAVVVGSIHVQGSAAGLDLDFRDPHFEKYFLAVQNGLGRLEMFLKTKIGKNSFTGNISLNPEQMRLLINLVRKLAELKPAESSITVCETGFNGGHSAVLYLESDPRVRYIGFDIGIYGSAKPAAQFIADQYGPSRVSLIWGDSSKTVPSFIQASLNVCDLIVVDGGHDYETCYADLKNLAQAAAEQAYVMVDDCAPINRLSMQASWERAVKEGLYHELQRKEVWNERTPNPVGTPGWCVGYRSSQPSQLDVLKAKLGQFAAIRPPM